MGILKESIEKSKSNLYTLKKIKSIVKLLKPSLLKEKNKPTRKALKANL
jgi:hypothetical protein